MEDTKPDVKPATSNEHLNLKVKNDQGMEIFFKVKRTTPMRKLMEHYCERVGTQKSTVRFLFDGQRIQEHHTPADLDMQDEDEIDAMVEQHGGFF